MTVLLILSACWWPWLAALTLLNEAADKGENPPQGEPRGYPEEAEGPRPRVTHVGIGISGAVREAHDGGEFAYGPAGERKAEG